MKYFLHVSYKIGVKGVQGVLVWTIISIVQLIHFTRIGAPHSDSSTIKILFSWLNSNRRG